jgi:hypothetical protein
MLATDFCIDINVVYVCVCGELVKVFSVEFRAIYENFGYLNLIKNF